MAFELPKLSFAENALEGWTSAETLSFHHGKHHAGYVKKLNAGTEGTNYAEQTLEEVVSASRGKDIGVFNNAAQHWNHSFFWKCLSPEAHALEGELSGMMARDFGSLEDFKEQFEKKALTLFGSGWAWLVQNKEGKLEILQYKDADTPFGTDNKPLLTLDVWEHAYYIDFRNDRAGFIEGFWKHVNWKHASEQL